MAIQVKHSDDHTIEVLDEVGMSYMALVIDRLNAALVKGGVKTARARKEICENFLFGLSYQLDAGWFEQDGSRYFPKVCFLERAKAKAGQNLGKVKVIHVPNEASSWHEYAMGVVAQYFEEGETVVPEVPTGSYEMKDE